MYLTFFTDKIWVFGTKSDANVVFFPSNLPFWGRQIEWKRLTTRTRSRFTRHSAEHEGRGAFKSIPSPQQHCEINVECTYRKHSLEDGPRSNTDSDSSEQQCKGLTKCDSYHSLQLFQIVTPLYLRTTTPPVKIQRNARGCHPKIQDRAYFSLASLSPRTRSRRGKQGERRARGVEADPRRERSKK